jgi:hypothetical protein
MAKSSRDNQKFLLVLAFGQEGKNPFKMGGKA